MERQPNNQPLAKVIELRPNGVERIAGIKLNLAAMSVQELQDLEQQTRGRVEDAQADHMIVLDYLHQAAGEEQL